jgi:hypothetical protein
MPCLFLNDARVLGTALTLICHIERQAGPTRALATIAIDQPSGLVGREMFTQAKSE